MERIEEIVREWTEKQAVTVDNIPVLFATITAQWAEIDRLTAELAKRNEMTKRSQFNAAWPIIDKGLEILRKIKERLSVADYNQMYDAIHIGKGLTLAAGEIEIKHWILKEYHDELTAELAQRNGELDLSTQYADALKAELAKKTADYDRLNDFEQTQCAKLLGKLARVEWERDSIFEDLAREQCCSVCKHGDKAVDEPPCSLCDAESKWQWRGAKEGKG